MSNVPDKWKTIKIKGPFRILNFTLTSRPIFVIHGIYKHLIKNSGGRLPLAGMPAEMDLEFDIKINTDILWKGKAVQRVSDLLNVEITSLAPGFVAVEGIKSPFLFYGNCWIQLAHTHLVKDEICKTDEELANDDEDGQLRFATAITKQETPFKPVESLTRKAPSVYKDSLRRK